MGRKLSRNSYHTLDSYVKKHRDIAKISSGSYVTIIGLLSIIFGLASSVLSCIFGQWAGNLKLIQHKKQYLRKFSFIHQTQNPGDSRNLGSQRER